MGRAPAPAPGRRAGGVRRRGVRRGRLRVRAQDRRARHLDPLRGRPLRAGRHPRRRAHGRGRHRQRRAPSPRCPSALGEGRARGARGAGRGLHAAVRLRGAQRAPGSPPSSGRSSTPATRRPGRSARRTRASRPTASSPSGATSSARSRAGPRFTSHHETLDWLGSLGFPVNPEIRRLSEPRRGAGLLPPLAAAPPRPRLRDRRRGRQGRRPGPPRACSASRPRRPAGRSPTSSRPRSAPPGCDDILVSIGRTGRATPFAVLEPVFVGGVTVGQATLHNEDQVAAKDVRPGDTVIVRRAGDVIPEVVGPVLADRPKGSKPWVFPTDVPVRAALDAGAARGRDRHRCINPECPFQRQGAIEHFASRGALDIEGFGEQRIRQLLDAGHGARRRRHLRPRLGQGRAASSGLGATSAANLRASIDASRQRPLPPACWSGSTSATSARPGPRRWPRRSATSTRSWRRPSRRWPRSTGSAPSSPSRCTRGSPTRPTAS